MCGGIAGKLHGGQKTSSGPDPWFWLDTDVDMFTVPVGKGGMPVEGREALTYSVDINFLVL